MQPQPIGQTTSSPEKPTSPFWNQKANPLICGL